MRKIECIDFHGETVEDVIEDINLNAERYGITQESDIISISARPATTPHNMGQPDGSLVKSEVVVSVFYWINE